MPQIQVIDIQRTASEPEALRPLEDEVPHQVARRQVNAAAVQGLEDRLRVITAFEFDRNHGEPVLQRLEQALHAQLVEFAIDHDMLFNLLPKVLVGGHCRAHDPVLVVRGRGDGVEVGIGIDDRHERAPVDHRWPQLEPLDLGILHDPVVVQVLVHLGRIGRIVLARHVPERREKKLKGGQPLLAVDDLEGLDLLPERLDLRDHHCAHEVRRTNSAVGLQTKHGPLDVLPQQFQLRANPPGVLSLIERDEIALLAVEELDDGPCVWTHFPSR